MKKTCIVLLFMVLFSMSNISAEEINFLFEITGKRGEKAKEFDNIQGVAGDSKGNVYIVDSDNNRVQVFNDKGEFLFQFGKKGDKNGEFNTPFGIAVNSQDEVYVSEQGNHRIQVFDNTGKFLFAFGQKGSQKGRFSSPSGITVDLHDFVYVADSGNDCVQVFTRQGIFVTSFGLSGDLPNPLNYPSSVAVDNERNIFIVDKKNNRVQKLDSRGYFLMNIGSKDSKKYKQLFSAVVSEYGTVYITDVDSNCIQVVSNIGDFLYSFGSKGNGRGQFLDLTGIYMDKKNRLYVADAKNNRVEVYQIKPDEKAQKKTPAQKPPEVIFIAEVPGQATDVAVDEHGNIYISNIKNNTIEVFNPDGTSKFIFGGEGEDKGKFRNPAGLAVSPDGNIAVSDNRNYRIQVFDSSGAYLFGFGRKGDEKGEFLSPAGVVYDGKGEKLYISDRKNDRVQIFNKDGVFLNTFGSSGSKSNQLTYPEDITLDSDDGTIYIADTGNNRVLRYNIFFANETSLGKNGKGRAEFDKPVCVGTDRDKKVYVLDRGNNRVQIFDGSLKFIMEFGSEGKGPGQFNDPQGLTVQNLNSQNYIYVADTENKRIQIFALSETPQPPVNPVSYGDEKGVKLAWDKNPESFVYEYNVYKSDSLTGNFAYIDKTRENGFFVPAPPDSTLAQPPYFRITAVTPRGVESAPSQTVTDYFTLGYNLLRENKIQESAANLQKETGLHPNNYNAHYWLGVIYFRQGKWQDAEKEFSVTIKLQPENGSAHYYLGASLSRQKAYDKAIIEFNEALKTVKDDFRVYSELGNANLNKEFYNDAIDAYKNAFLLGETDMKTHYNLGFAYYKQHKYDPAIEELQKYAESNPGEFDAHYYLGKVFAEQGKDDLAVKSFRKASEIAPQNHEVFFLIGSVFMNQKSYKDAVAEFRVAGTINPKNAVYKYNLGLAYFYNDDKENAVREFGEAAKLEPENPDYHYYAGLAYFGTDTDKALKEFNTVADLNPNYQGVYLKLGALYEKKKLFPEAIEAYKKALEKNSGDTVLINYSLGRLYLESRDYVLSEKHFEDVTKADKNNMDAQLQLGIVQSLQEKNGDAIQSFQKVIALDTRNVKARGQLAAIFGKTKMNNEAVGEYRKILEIDPLNADSFYNLGIIYMNCGLFDQARGFFTKAGESGKDNLLYKNAFDSLNAFIEKEHENIVRHITPSDPVIVNFTKNTLNQYQGKNEYNVTNEFYKTLIIYDGISTYGVICTAQGKVTDFSEPKQPQYARDTLKNKIGNSLDCAIFLSACLESEGIAASIIKNQSFTILLANTGASIEEVEKISGDTTMYIEKNNFAWIPVDVSVFGSSFTDAWKQGLKKYNEYLTMEEKGEMFNVKEYRVRVAEDKLPESDFNAEIPKEKNFNSVLQADFEKFNKGKLASLIIKYNEKLKVNPDDLQTRLALANAYKESALNNEASKEYEEALKLDEKNLTALYFLGNYALSNQKRDDALNYFSKILVFYPQEPAATFEMAEIYYSQEKTEKALEYYQKYLKLNTSETQKNGSAQLKTGLCYASLKEMKRAIEELEKFIKDYPGHELIEDTKKTLEILKSGYSEE